MPDMMKLHQPHNALLLRRPSKESPRNGNGFPEYLKHADILGDGLPQLKLTASNSLFHAVLKGRVRATRYLLERSTTVNTRNDYGYSILTASLHVDEDKRRDKLFRLLLDKGADPMFKDATYGRNVLHWACLLGRTVQVKTLLEDFGGDMDLTVKDNDHHTALHHAVMAGHLPIVTLLVDTHRRFGITVDVADKLGLTPYLHAKRLGYRDVAEYLHTEGLASQGHGDMLFRTPREWSQIGKFERKKAIEIHTQEAINIAKIRGKITHARRLEDTMLSPRMAVPNIVLPSYSPSEYPDVKLAVRHPNDRVSSSLPSLQDHVSGGIPRPSSANGSGKDTVDAADGPGPAKEAFVSTSHQGILATQGGGTQDPAEGTGNGIVSTGHGRPGSMAFKLMEMNEKGRHARSYRQSQFDETKASEYQHIMGNLNAIMDVLSQQQSKSFRKSVKYQKPETPKVKKRKNKVSSLAVIFGRDKSGRLSNKKRSPKPSAKKGVASSKKEKAGGGGGGTKGNGEEKKAKASEKKKIVPQLKVNDNAV